MSDPVVFWSFGALFHFKLTHFYCQTPSLRTVIHKSGLKVLFIRKLLTYTCRKSFVSLFTVRTFTNNWGHSTPLFPTRKESLQSLLTLRKTTYKWGLTTPFYYLKYSKLHISDHLEALTVSNCKIHKNKESLRVLFFLLFIFPLHYCKRSMDDTTRLFTAFHNQFVSKRSLRTPSTFINKLYIHILHLLYCIRSIVTNNGLFWSHSSTLLLLPTLFLLLAGLGRSSTSSSSCSAALWVRNQWHETIISLLFTQSRPTFRNKQIRIGPSFSALSFSTNQRPCWKSSNQADWSISYIFGLNNSSPDCRFRTVISVNLQADLADWSDLHSLSKALSFSTNQRPCWELADQADWSILCKFGLHNLSHNCRLITVIRVNLIIVGFLQAGRIESSCFWYEYWIPIRLSFCCSRIPTKQALLTNTTLFIVQKTRLGMGTRTDCQLFRLCRSGFPKCLSYFWTNSTVKSCSRPFSNNFLWENLVTLFKDGPFFRKNRSLADMKASECHYSWIRFESFGFWQRSLTFMPTHKFILTKVFLKALTVVCCIFWPFWPKSVII